MHWLDGLVACLLQLELSLEYVTQKGQALARNRPHSAIFLQPPADPNPNADVPSGTGNNGNPSSDGGATGGPLLMPGGEEFDATLVEALFMNELLALNDLVTSSDGDGDGGDGGEGDVTSGFEGLAGLLGSSVPGSPPVPPSGPMLGGSDMTTSAGQQLAVSPLRPSAPHRTEAAESVPPARAGAAAADAASTMAPCGETAAGADEPKQLMVHQFATLAGKLGVHLPPNILSALSQAAEASASASASASANDSTSVSACSDSVAAESFLARQAEESIAAIEGGSRKRKASSPPGGGAGSAALPLPSSLPSPTIPANLDAASSSADASSEAASKKKKPRLQDTATRYAALKAENETLKRHLANVTHTTTLVDKERAEAERKLAGMVTKETADERQVGPVLEKFGEMYSDYGRRRQEELTFHLEQLERYVLWFMFVYGMHILHIDGGYRLLQT